MNIAGKRGKKNFDLEAIVERQMQKELMEELVSHSWLSGLFLSVGSSDTLMSLSRAGDCGEVASQEGFLFSGIEGRTKNSYCIYFYNPPENGVFYSHTL